MLEQKVLWRVKCNVCGHKAPDGDTVTLARLEAQHAGWLVLVDLTAACPSCKDLPPCMSCQGTGYRISGLVTREEFTCEECNGSGRQKETP